MWNKLEAPDWRYFAVGSSFAVGSGLVGIGRWGAAMSGAEWAIYSIAFLGLALMLFSLRPTLQSLPFVKRWHQMGKERAKRRTQEALRRQDEPHCRAWDQFLPAADDLVKGGYDFRYDDTRPDNWRAVWQGVLKQRAAVALRQAGALLRHRARAEELIRPFTKAEEAKSPEDFALPLATLKHWLEDTERSYRGIRARAGIEQQRPPTPPAQPSPAPP